VIGIVGLLVIGPERLPGAARTCALWIGRLKRSLAATRAELEKHIGADEIRRELHNEQVLYNLEKMKDQRRELEARIRALDPGTNEAVAPESKAADPVSTDDNTSPPPAKP
jgi:sec-independent protein translocase protein TatB